MRKAFRYFVSGIAAFGLLILGGLAVYTAETVADELGYSGLIRGLIKRGWSAMIETGYFELSLWFVLFFFGAAAALWVDYFLRPKNTFVETKIRVEERVRGKFFRNMEIILDGMAYEDCNFYNVTFVYDGGFMEMTGNKIHGCDIRTNIRQIEYYVKFLGELGFVDAPFYGPNGKLEFSGFEKHTIPKPNE